MQSPTIYRADYTPLAWVVDTVDLHFALDPAATVVTSRMVIRRNSAASAEANTNAPLPLFGEELELLSFRVDGLAATTEQLRHTEKGLELVLTQDQASLDIVTRICPEKNTSLTGLYTSRGGFFTQCEAEGFRRITYFPDRPDVMARYSVTLEAEQAAYPVLLSNGNLLEQGNLPNGRHFARWQDPFPKPSYLFALVAAKLVVNEERFTTASGREVLLQIWVEDGNLPHTTHAMESLKRSMRWDESRFGLELDLDRFMIVAVSDFNMGAMENKGLNIFNSKLLLATPDTATDLDYDNIESVVAHEYFHNWTGNRVTCRDWFQLTLKEGLTVYRDEEFSADMFAAAGGESARAVKRIEDVRVLWSAQFPEDSGPMAHPIRPESYQEINNFYTATVYEKGAEVIRMIATLIGRDNFRKGMDLYFARHDGQAVTCDDFVAAMADASAYDLSQFTRWYSQAGTPRLQAWGDYDAAKQTYTLHFKQSTPITSITSNQDQSQKQTLTIPIKLGLIGLDGNDLTIDQIVSNGLYVLTEAEASLTFPNLAAAPIPSLLRGYSAPVILEMAETPEALAFRMAHDSDPFNRWQAGQQAMENVILALARHHHDGDAFFVPPAFYTAYAHLLQDESLDPAFLAQALALPAETYLLEKMQPADPLALRHAMMHLTASLGRQFATTWLDLYARHAISGAYRYHPADAGKRSLRNLALRYLLAAGNEEGKDLAMQQFRHANLHHNMGERLGALSALVNSHFPERDIALGEFHRRHAHDALVLDKWFAVQALAWHWDNEAPNTLEAVASLLRHPDFNLANPNKVYALLGSFFRTNPGEFHRADGSGYAFWAEQIRALNALNPQVASRMARTLERWKNYTPTQQALIQPHLEALAQADLSRDVAEIIGKALGR